MPGSLTFGPQSRRNSDPQLQCFTD